MRTPSKPELRPHLGLLLGLANVELLPMNLSTLERCRYFANWVDDLGGRLDLGASAMAAIECADDEDEPDSVYVVTATPELYGDAVPIGAIRGVS
jgi:hypothetical protein